MRRMLERTYGKGEEAPLAELGARTLDFAGTASDGSVPFDGVGNGAALERSPVAESSRAVESLLAQLVADKGTLAGSIQRCEERLAALTSRLDAEITVRTEEIRKTLARIRMNHELALTQLRGEHARTASEAMQQADEALRSIQEESQRVKRQSEESLAAARALIGELKADEQRVDPGTEPAKIATTN